MDLKDPQEEPDLVIVEVPIAIIAIGVEEIEGKIWSQVEAKKRIEALKGVENTVEF